MDHLEPKSLIQIIAEKEFLPLAQEICVSFFKTHNAFCLQLSKTADINRKFYTSLIQESEFFECFLDEHGARENKTWHFFAEYVASIRNLAIGAFLIKHLVDRYPYYNLTESEEFSARFHTEAQKTLDFLNQSIYNLFQEVINAGRANHLVIPTESVDPEGFADIETNQRLPKNIEEDHVKDEDERIVDLCHKVHNVTKMMEEINLGQIHDVDKLKKVIPARIDEKKARLLKNIIHSVQSDYDTYVKNTRLEQKYPSVKMLRGYVSLPLHLLEALVWLSHFYERHEDEIRSGECKTKITTLVDKNNLLDRIVNFIYFNALHFIKRGDSLSDELLKGISKIVTCEVPVPKPLGFHARPSTYVSLIVRQHEGDAYLVVDGEKYNAKSVMSLLQAGGAIADKGYEKVTFEGDKQILDDIRVLAKYNYCEDQKIPRELDYLRVLRNTA